MSHHRGGASAHLEAGSRVGAAAVLSTTAAATSLLALLVLTVVPPGGTTTAARALVLALFWLVGPGGALVVRLRLRPLTAIALVPLVGMGALLVLSAAGTWSGLWLPRLTTAVVALAALASCLPRLRQDLARLRELSRRTGRTGGRSGAPVALPVLLAVMAVALWLSALPTARGEVASPFGLLAARPVSFGGSVVLLAALLVLGLRRRSTWITATAGAGLLLVVRTTTSVVTSAPSPYWSYKHIGVVDLLQRTHALAPGNDIYMHWPAMFTASAWFADASGLSVLDLARWMTPVVDVVLALQVAALARSLGARGPASAGAAGLAVALNWVGQDYFSPQSIAICLAAGVLVLLADTSAAAWRTPSAVMAVTVFAVVVPTHQLTPFWVLGLTVVLVVLRRVPAWVPVVMAAVVVAYLVPRLGVVASYGLFSGFDPVSNATGNVPGASAEGRTLGGIVARAAALVVWLSTLAVLAWRARAVGWRRLLRTRGLVVSAVIAFSPFALLGGQSYGGEAILRVVLYSTPGCAAVLGMALARAAAGRRPALTAAAAWTGVALIVTTQAYYGTWWVNLVRPADVATARWLYERAPDARVVTPNGAWPGPVWLDYQGALTGDRTLQLGLNGALAGVGADAITAGERATADDLRETIAEQSPAPETYVVFSAMMQAYDTYYGTFAPGDYEALQASVASAPDFELVHRDGATVVYRYLGAA